MGPNPGIHLQLRVMFCIDSAAPHRLGGCGPAPPFKSDALKIFCQLMVNGALQTIDGREPLTVR